MAPSCRKRHPRPDLPRAGGRATWRDEGVAGPLQPTSCETLTAVDMLLLVPLIVVVFLVLLLTGRALVAKGSNRATANGATLLTLAAVVGVLALGLVVSLDVW